MVRVKVWHTHTTVWLVENYRQRILAYYTRIILLDLTYGRTMPSLPIAHARESRSVSLRETVLKTVTLVKM